MSTPPLDADGAAALLAAAERRAGGLHFTPDGVTTLQATQLGGAEPDQDGG
jgi:hypothetical protein